jgi:hypothetical protein
MYFTAFFDTSEKSVGKRIFLNMLSYLLIENI